MQSENYRNKLEFFFTPCRFHECDVLFLFNFRNLVLNFDRNSIIHENHILNIYAFGIICTITIYDNRFM